MTVVLIVKDKVGMKFSIGHTVTHSAAREFHQAIDPHFPTKNNQSFDPAHPLEKKEFKLF